VVGVHFGAVDQARGPGATILNRIRLITAAASVSLGPAPRRGPGMRGYDWVGNASMALTVIFPP